GSAARNYFLPGRGHNGPPAREPGRAKATAGQVAHRALPADGRRRLAGSREAVNRGRERRVEGIGILGAAAAGPEAKPERIVQIRGAQGENLLLKLGAVAPAGIGPGRLPGARVVEQFQGQVGRRAVGAVGGRTHHAARLPGKAQIHVARCSKAR
nr:hypothetical protein [Tanacetum cinerariifolium]